MRLALSALVGLATILLISRLFAALEEWSTGTNPGIIGLWKSSRPVELALLTVMGLQLGTLTWLLLT